MSGPLAGLRVVELAGLGPAPHAAMMLADLGADVVRVVGPVGRGLRLGSDRNVVLRGRRTVHADLKTDEGRRSVLGLVERADVLIEGLRPGVAERLGVGPADCMVLNPRLVYGRITGWGQDGPLARTVGHDLNYIGLTGALHAIGRSGQPPPPPLNLVGDFGGGSMLLIVGILAALHERNTSGLGQVIDAAMVDGTAVLSQMTMALRGISQWTDDRESNLLDGGAPFYDTYTCSDEKWVAVGALEPQFFAALLVGLQIPADELPNQLHRPDWPRMRRRFEDVFKTRTRDEWAEHFGSMDACVTPVLTFGEAPLHPHLQARGTYVEVDGIMQAAPAPRFSRTPSDPPMPKSVEEAGAEQILREWS